MLHPISTTVSRGHSEYMMTERLKHNGGSVPEAKDHYCHIEQTVLSYHQALFFESLSTEILKCKANY